MRLKMLGWMAMACLVAGSAQAMTVQEFLGKVDGLKAKGPFALFSPDIGRLKREGEGAMDRWYAQADPPGPMRNACPPTGKIDLSDSEFLGMLKAVPVPQRQNISVAQAVTSAMNRRYPCRS